VVILNCIWKTRIDVIFNNASVSALDVLYQVRNRVDEITELAKAVGGYPGSAELIRETLVLFDGIILWRIG